MNKIYLYIVIGIIITSIIIFSSKTTQNMTNIMTEQEISDLTDMWCNMVTVSHDPVAIANMFCSDGNLIGTVSQDKRKGDDIKLYFDYFAKLSGIMIVDKHYNISKVTDNVFINTAFITWLWDGMKTPIVARMTFVFRDRCLFQ